MLDDLNVWAMDVIASYSLMGSYDRVPDYKELAHHIANQYQELYWIKKEIWVLRSYGNKDCTAMADEALDEVKRKHYERWMGWCNG